MTTQTYQEVPITMGKAAKKYGIPLTTLAYWVKIGRIKVLQRPERKGQALLVDEASVVLARQTYTAHGTTAPFIPHNVGQLPTDTQLPNIETAALIEKFNHYNRRLAESTREGYHYRLKDFQEHFPTLPLEPGPIQDYIDDMPYSDAHRHTCAALLRTLYRWAYRQHHIPKHIESPIDLIKFPPDGRKGKLARTLSDEEANAVINAGRNFEERTMLNLLWTSGIRAGELRSLKGDMLYPPDSAIPQPSIRPHGKMGERKVWITDQLYKDLTLLAESRPGDYLFLDRNKKQLTTSGLYQRVRWCMEKAGLKGKKLGPYTFRHTFVTDIIADSGDVALAKELAGHSQISTTLKYTHLAPKHMAEGFAKFTPEHRRNGKTPEETPEL